MAVPAVNPKSGDVMLMAEGHRLRLAHSCVGDVRRTLDLQRSPTERGNHEDRAKNRGPRQGVGAAMENLRHALSKSTLEMSRPPCWVHSPEKTRPRFLGDEQENSGL